MHTHKERMTADQARTFTTYSVGNVVRVKQALACGCEPYQDVFTYRRWQALGFQVQKGQHNILKHGIANYDPS